MENQSSGWKDNKLFLLDAYALIYRAYFAFSRTPLINSKGQNTSAINGFTSTLIDLIKKENPTHMAVVFDAPGGSEAREAVFTEYKANRQEMPEDIRWAIPYIRQIIEAFRIPILEKEGFEADDVIGTIALQKTKEGHVVYMVTPDKDYAQLVGPNCYIYKPGRQGNDTEILGVKEVCEKWEVNHPTQVIDILGLWGDAVDNIPGVPGVGEKTAKKLIKEFGSVENVIAHADQIKGKVGENIKTFAEQGLLSKQLATIILDVPIEVSDEALVMEKPDTEKLSDLFAMLEFRNLGKRILGEQYTVNKPVAGTQGDLFSMALPAEGEQEVLVPESGKNLYNTPHDYALVDTPEKLDALLQKLSESEVFCFDTETTSLDYFSLELVGMSFSVKAGEAYYVACPSDFDQTMELVSRFKPLLESSQHQIVGQNIKFDLLVMRRYGVRMGTNVWDTMIAHYLLEPDMKHNMDYLSETYLKYTPVSIETLIGKKGKNQISMREVEVELVKEYAAEDADVTLQLKQHFEPLVQEHGVKSVLEEIELPLIPVLADMEYEGVRVDSGFLSEYAQTLLKDLIETREAIFKIAGTEFNVDSPKQLGEVLFGHLGLPYQGPKTKTGQYATGEEVLSLLRDKHPIIDPILTYREIAKLKSTYVDALPLLVNPKTGRVHTTFNQTIAATGRLSSINPNLQNIPIRTQRGQHIRKAFVPRDEHHVLLSADYSQIELRLVAELSGDENMLNAFEQKMDIHQATASRVYGIPLEAVTKEMRSKAKMVNFGIIYAISAFGLSQRLNISRAEAKGLIDNYFEQFPGIRKYMDETLAFARSQGYVKTIKGRRRYLKDINSANFTVRGFAEREAINAPVQGSAADMIKLAMIQIHEALRKEQLRTKMTLQIHDELIFDVPKEEISIVEPLIREKMLNAIPTRVPLEVEIGKGYNWLEAH